MRTVNDDIRVLQKCKEVDIDKQKIMQGCTRRLNNQKVKLIFVKGKSSSFIRTMKFKGGQ